MTDDALSETQHPKTLAEALQEYLDTLAPEVHNTHGVYVRRCVEAVGPDLEVTALTGARVELYAEAAIQPSDPAANERAMALKSWFQFLKKRNYTDKNYGVHIRVRKTAGRNGSRRQQVRVEEAPIEMTADGIAALRRELAELEAKRPDLERAIAHAREDKDFRENAPLDAAREALAFNESRRREIENTLKRAVAAAGGAHDVSRIGSVVRVSRLDTGRTETYQLVGAREANAAQRKISVESPVGRQLLGRRPGDEVTVEVPSGVLQFRIESVEAQ